MGSAKFVEVGITKKIDHNMHEIYKKNIQFGILGGFNPHSPPSCAPVCITKVMLPYNIDLFYYSMHSLFIARPRPTSIIEL